MYMVLMLIYTCIYAYFRFFYVFSRSQFRLLKRMVSTGQSRYLKYLQQGVEGISNILNRGVEDIRNIWIVLLRSPSSTKRNVLFSGPRRAPHQRKAMQSHAKQCKAMQSNAKHSKAKQRKAMKCNAKQSKAKQCNATLALPFAIRETLLGSRWDIFISFVCFRGVYMNGLLGALNYDPPEGLDEHRTANRESFDINKLFPLLNDLVFIHVCTYPL